MIRGAAARRARTVPALAAAGLLVGSLVAGGFVAGRFVAGGWAPAYAASCGDAAIIAARGSGETPNDTDYPGSRAVVFGQVLHDRYGVRLYTQTPEQNSYAYGYEIGVDYPAPNVDLFNDLKGYKASVSLGIGRLLATITSVRDTCGASFPIMLAGFSQGAEVVQGALIRLDLRAGSGDSTWRSIKAAVLMGSPRFSPTDGSARGTFVVDNLAGIREDVVANVPARFTNRTRTYCFRHDPVCQYSGANLIQYTSVHSVSYLPGTSTGILLDSDAEGLFLWAIRRSSGKEAYGRLSASRTAVSGHVRVSAAWVLPRGAPTVSFRWDFSNNGSVDATSKRAWFDHYFGTAQAGQATSVTTRVQIIKADGHTISRTICIRRAAGGAATC